jgi:PAS domain S-box-containing protein
VTLLTLIVILSILFQLSAAILAVRLIRVTRSTAAWLFVALAIGFMAVRRIESLVFILSGHRSPTPDLVFELVGLVTSVFMLAGIYLIQPLFATIVRSKDEISAAKEKLSVLSGEQQLLLDFTRDFIYRHDPQGIITYVSPAVERITGFTPAEWLRHYATHYTDNPQNADGIKATEAMLQTGKAGPSYMIEVNHREGGTVWLEINKQPYLEHGKVAGFIGVARDITRRVELARERTTLITDLQEAMAKIRSLKGLLPICASCKKIRDDQGYWSQIEVYISEHSEAEFSHGICPDCARRIYPDLVDKLGQ